MLDTKTFLTKKKKKYPLCLFPTKILFLVIHRYIYVKGENHVKSLPKMFFFNKIFGKDFTWFLSKKKLGGHRGGSNIVLWKIRKCIPPLDFFWHMWVRKFEQQKMGYPTYHNFSGITNKEKGIFKDALEFSPQIKIITGKF